MTAGERVKHHVLTLLGASQELLESSLGDGIETKTIFWLKAVITGLPPAAFERKPDPDETQDVGPA